MSSGKILLSLLAGVAIGGIAGILFAPQKGVRTRKLIAKKSDAYADSLKEQFDEFIDSISGKYDKLQDEVSDFTEEVKSKVEDVKAKVEDLGANKKTAKS